VALLAGGAGILSNHYLYLHPASGTFIFFEQAVYVVPVAVAVAALVLRNHRPVMLGLLQGMWWPSAAWLAWDIAAFSIKASIGSVAGYYSAAAANALGVLAAILLLVAWNASAGRSQVQRWGAIRVMLVCSASLSQIAGLLLYQSPAFHWAAHAFYTQGVAAIVVGLAVSWYAVSRRARSLGGSLLLGWAIITAIWLISTVLWLPTVSATLTGVPRVSAVLEFVLIAVAVILAIIYMRGPPNRYPSHREQ
jgi:hypothetical protein